MNIQEYNAKYNEKFDNKIIEGSSWTLLSAGSVALTDIPECNELLIMGKAQSYYSFSQSLILPKERFDAIVNGRTSTNTIYLYLHTGEDNAKELELKITTWGLSLSSGDLYVYYR